ncbi:MAG: hypothetical protein ABIJ27_00205 [Candidatus Omnitrophota bacterium]
MCREECPKYDLCYENDDIREDCCRRCPEYSDCNGYAGDGRQKSKRASSGPESDDELI